MNIPIETLVTQFGSAGLLCAFMWFVIRYFMAELAKKDKRQDEILEKLMMVIESNTRESSRVAMILDQMAGVAPCGLYKLSSASTAAVFDQLLQQRQKDQRDQRDQRDLREQKEQRQHDRSLPKD